MTALAWSEVLQRAVAAYQRGDLSQAERLCRQILESNADHFDALHLSGFIAAQTRRAQEAVDLLTKAVAVNPRDAGAHGARAYALYHLRRFDEALASYDRALALKDDGDTWYNRGNVLFELRRYDDALASYDRALGSRPNHAYALYNRGNALRELKRPQEALASYDRALELAPSSIDVLNGRGNVLVELTRAQEALASYARALALRPDHVDTLINCGNALRSLERPQQALESYDRALTIRRDHPDALYNRGNALRELKRVDEALEGYARALAIKPDHVAALYSHGAALRALNRHADALQSYRRALEVEPDHADALNGLALVLGDLRRSDEALETFGRALAISPDHASAHFNRALLRLRLGDFSNGWPEFEWRWKEKQAEGSRRDFPQPLWLGAESLQGKTILVHAEAGYGDALQFCRYVPMVAAFGSTVLLEVDPRLVPLLTCIEGAARVLAKGALLPDFDYHCPLMSLPLAFKTEIHTIPADIRYVRSDPARVDAWRKRLGGKTRPRVGLVWSGSSEHLNDRNRSIALDQVLPLMHDGIEWIAPQPELRPADVALLATRSDIRWLGRELKDFADTAALVELLDLVVTVDTSVAHLAGAMGKPVWILLPQNSDWRWLLDREDSPWYPSARLIRQTAFGDWVSVLDRVGRELSRQFAEGA